MNFAELVGWSFYPDELDQSILSINSFILIIEFLVHEFAFQISKYIFVRVYSLSPEL